MNEFKWFGTLTFSDSGSDNKADNLEYCNKKLRYWLINQRKNFKFEYLIVPEIGNKNGRVHYHCLFDKNYNGNFVDSTKKDNAGRTIYNLKSWRAGFSNFTKIGDKDKVSSYVRKYITKDLVDRDEKKRYWRSQGLLLPKKRNNVDLSDLEIYAKDILYQTDFLLAVKKPIDS